MEIEVASARLEDYDKSSRKPKEVKYTDINGDLKRRDFTVNAMAVDLLPKTFGDLYDPYNGIADLKAKRLITPLDPDETLSEEPLSMMRAAVFASRFNIEIDEEEKNLTFTISDIENMLDMLAINKRDNYTDWINVGLCLHNINNKYNYELAEKIIASGIKIHWGGYFTFKNLDEDLLKILKKSGLQHVEFGTEAIAEKIGMSKKHLSEKMRL